MQERLKRRDEIDVQLTWDLSNLFPSEEKFFQAIEVAKSEADMLRHTYKGKVNSAKDALELIVAYDKLKVKISHIENYAELALSVDMGNEICQKHAALSEMALAEIQTNIKFVEDALLALPIEILDEAGKNTSRYQSYLKNLAMEKAHRLSAASEELLATLSPVLNLPYNGYNVTKLSDMHFPDFEADGVCYPLSYVLFENTYQHHPSANVRRKAFETFSKKLEEYKNTTANYYTTQINKEKIISKLRGFDSVIDYLLFSQRVPRELYDRQIDTIMEALAPHMRRYAKLLQKVHGLEEIRFSDLKISLDGEFDPKVSIEESKEYVKGALSALGKEYVDMVMRSYEERWVDFAQNIGKSTGGFCASPYQKNAFILLSWNGMLSEVFTLVHELGHAGHFHLAQENNSILEEECSLYFVEAPSTANEMLLSNYLMKQSEDKRFRRWVLSSMIGNTYFHNFVTHLLEAAYQREVYLAVDRGESLQASDFSRIKRDVLEKFWGDAVIIDEGAELTWMRQPHYYMGLYSYTYSAGLTVATQISNRILHEGENAVKDWLEVLKAGGSKTAVELAKMAGVDITTDAPLRSTIAFIGDMITQMEALSEEL